MADELDFESNEPLAARMRPRSLDELVGQDQIVGPGTPLRTLIEADRPASIILWGPAGTGKTSLAGIIAEQTRANFVPMSAVNATVAEVRKVIAGADASRQKTGRRTILFLDEIHRFSKSQQDALLPAVEDGRISLIGATTENPYFSVNSPLLSRSAMFRLEPLSKNDILLLLKRALDDKDRGLGLSSVSVDEAVFDYIVDRCGGDALPRLMLWRYACRQLLRPGRRWSSSNWPSRPSRDRSCTTMKTPTTTSSRPSLRACAAPTRMPRSGGWPRCSKPERMPVSSPAAW